MTDSGDREECQGKPPKTEHIVILPHEMDEIDVAGYLARTRLNADTSHDHGIISWLDVVLTDINGTHVLQDCKTKRPDIKNSRRFLTNLESQLQ
jgi:hypothetical protein